MISRSKQPKMPGFGAFLDEKLLSGRFPAGPYSNFSVRQAKPGKGEWVT
jgi:hypothetical protein